MACDRADFFVLKGSDNVIQGILFQPAVRIDGDDDFAFGVSDPFRQRFPFASVFFEREKCYLARILLHDLRDVFDRVVRRTIVDADDLPLLVGGMDAGEKGMPYVFPFVIYRYNDGNERTVVHVRGYGPVKEIEDDLIEYPQEDYQRKENNEREDHVFKAAICPAKL